MLLNPITSYNNWTISHKNAPRELGKDQITYGSCINDVSNTTIPRSIWLTVQYNTSTAHQCGLDDYMQFS